MESAGCVRRQAAEFWIDCSFLSVLDDELLMRLLQWSSLEVVNAWTRVLEAERGEGWTMGNVFEMEKGCAGDVFDGRGRGLDQT